jgi:hypothetical protein
VLNKKTTRRQVKLFQLRKTQIESPIKLNHKRFYSSQVPDYFPIVSGTYASKSPSIKKPSILNDANFLKETFSFSTRLRPTLIEPSKLPKLINPKRKYLTKETISYSIKKRHVQSKSTEPTWNLNLRLESPYMPSLNNLSYTPAPWLSENNSSAINLKLSKSNHSKLLMDKKQNGWSSSLLSIMPSTMEASVEILH